MKAAQRQEANREELKGETPDNQQSKVVKGLYIPILFLSLYVFVLLVYYGLALRYGSAPFQPSLESKVLIFFTSPFNPLENFIGTQAHFYSSIQDGLTNNLVFPVILIFISICYYPLLANNRVSPQVVFWASVGASYLLSASRWLLTGSPSMGTSLIGFCLALFLLFGSLLDWSSCLKTPKSERTNKLFTRYLIATIILSFSLYAAYSYIFNNPAFANHLIGGLLCGFLVFLTLKVKRWRIRPSY